MTSAAFDHLTPEQLRELAAQLTQQVHYYKTRGDQLAHEIAVLKRHRFEVSCQ